MKKFLLLLVSGMLAIVVSACGQEEAIQKNKEVPVEEQLSNDIASSKVPAKPRRKGTGHEKPKEEKCEIAESSLT